MGHQLLSCFLCFLKFTYCPQSFWGLGGFLLFFFCFCFCFAKVESQVPVFSAWLWGTSVAQLERPRFKCRDVATLTRTHCPGFFLFWTWSPGIRAVGGVGEGVALVILNGGGPTGTLGIDLHAGC